MFNRKEHYASPILHRFSQQNIIIGMDFYLSPVIPQNKIVMINLFLLW